MPEMQCFLQRFPGVVLKTADKIGDTPDPVFAQHVNHCFIAGKSRAAVFLCKNRPVGGGNGEVELLQSHVSKGVHQLRR